MIRRGKKIESANQNMNFEIIHKKAVCCQDGSPNHWEELGEIYYCVTPTLLHEMCVEYFLFH